MVIYNITSRVDQTIDSAWLNWVNEEMIPAIMNTGCFEAFRKWRLLDQDDSDGKTYALQFHSATEELYNEFIRLHAPAIRQRAIQKWGDKTISFHSALREI